MLHLSCLLKMGFKEIARVGFLFLKLKLQKLIFPAQHKARFYCKHTLAPFFQEQSMHSLLIPPEDKKNNMKTSHLQYHPQKVWSEYWETAPKLEFNGCTRSQSGPVHHSGQAAVNNTIQEKHREVHKGKKIPWHKDCVSLRVFSFFRYRYLWPKSSFSGKQRKHLGCLFIKYKRSSLPFMKE